MSCSCGSDKESVWIYDAKGIPLVKACEDCREKKLSVYRPEVLSDPNYFTTEPVEPEDY